jgi:hypothetical protein
VSINSRTTFTKIIILFLLYSPFICDGGGLDVRWIQFINFWFLSLAFTPPDPLDDDDVRWYTIHKWKAVSRFGNLLNLTAMVKVLIDLRFYHHTFFSLRYYSRTFSLSKNNSQRVLQRTIVRQMFNDTHDFPLFSSYFHV